MHAFGVTALFISLICNIANAGVISGRVVGVADGDTVTLLESDHTQHKIRISGIDAPEKKQPFGERSKANMSALAFGKDAEAECNKKDRYKRDVCIVRVSGRDVGLEQIKAGLAWWYREYSREQTPQERRDYEQAETAAKASGLALWSDPMPQPPWEWRHSKRPKRE